MIDYIELFRDMKKFAKKSGEEWDMNFDEFKDCVHTMIMNGDIECDWATMH